MDSSNTSTKRNFSKYDPSGTDPNRYATVSNPTEAAKYLNKNKQSVIPGLRVNVGTAERIIMVAGGAYLLYRALKKNDKQKAAESIAAGTMLFRGVTGYCPAYDAMSHTNALKAGNVTITTSLSVDSPVSEVYQAWRQLENLPLFMSHLHSVMVIDEYTSQWKARVPGGLGTIEWKAEILMDEPNSLISWHSLPGSTVDNSGKVKFVSNGPKTEIEATISYRAPLGVTGEAAAKLLNPVFENMVKNDIASFKEYIEKKETATV